MGFRYRSVRSPCAELVVVLWTLRRGFWSHPEHKRFFCVSLCGSQHSCLCFRKITWLWYSAEWGKKKSNQYEEFCKNSTMTKAFDRVCSSHIASWLRLSTGCEIFSFSVTLMSSSDREWGCRAWKKKKNHILWQPFIESGIVFRLSGTFHDCFLNGQFTGAVGSNSFESPRALRETDFNWNQQNMYHNKKALKLFGKRQNENRVGALLPH